MTGVELAELVVAWIDKHGLSRGRASEAIFGSRGGIYRMRKASQPTRRVVDRALEFIASPPPEHLKPMPLGRPRGDGLPPGPNNPRTRSTCSTKAEREYRRANAIRTRKIMASNRRMAMERINAGLPPESAPFALKHTQKMLEDFLAAKRRERDPLEQAKLKLRRAGVVIYSCAVVGGPRDCFIVSGHGTRPIPAKEVMSIASRIKREAA